MRASHASEDGASGTPIPWLAALVAAACIAVTFWGHSVETRVSQSAAEDLAQARAYFLDHPYLEPGRALGAELGPAVVEQERREFESRRIARGSVRTPPGVVRRQQERLDAMLAAARVVAEGLPAQRIGVVPAREASVSWVAHALLHGRGLHVAGNVLILLFLGLYLERAGGRLLFAAQTLAVTLAGAAVFSASFPAVEREALVGGTPLVAGLLTVFAVRHWASRNEGYYVSALVLGTLWVALPPWLGVRWSLADAQLSGAGHPLAATAVYHAIAGAAGCGLATVLLAALTGLDRRAPRTAGVSAHPLYARAMRAREQGRTREAFEALERLVREEPESHPAAVALAEVAGELGRPADAGAALLRAIRIAIKGGDGDTAVGDWLELTEAGHPEDAEPALLIRLALLLREREQPRSAVAALRRALERSSESAAHVVASRVAKAARDLDPAVAEAAAWRALGSVDLTLEDRQALEGLLEAVLPPPGDRVTRAFPSHAEPPRPASGPSPEPLLEMPDDLSHPVAIPIETRDRVLDAVNAVPLELDADGVQIATDDGRKKLLRYERIEALAVGAVHGLGDKPVIVVDLVLNWMTPANETLRVIRLRGDRFDPRRLVEGASSPVEALRGALRTIVERSGTTPLPDPDSACGSPFATFADLTQYQRTVLLVEAPETPAG